MIYFDYCDINCRYIHSHVYRASEYKQYKGVVSLAEYDPNFGLPETPVTDDEGNIKGETPVTDSDGKHVTDKTEEITKSE